MYDNRYADSKPLHILEIVDVDNMVDELGTNTLIGIGSRVVTEYDVDKVSMRDWLERNELALKLTDMKQAKVSDPWTGAANTKLPLVLNAAMKASAEEFAEIMRGSDMVQAEMFGKETEEKQARGERVTKRMNYQFYHELEDWEEDHDKLIMAKNIVGTVHKKIYYDKNEKQTQCILRRNGIVINDNVEKLKNAPRVTDEFDKMWWEVEEKVRSKEWTEITLTQTERTDYAESDKANEFLEQIRREDLDQDGYPEPYIVTVHKATKQVVRIVPNFTPESIQFEQEGYNQAEYSKLEDPDKKKIQKKLDVARIDTTKSRIKYIKYSMIPSWEGGYWDFGYGVLLGPLNDNCNKLINQLLNQGHLQAKGGGFINAGIKMAGGELRFKSNEWKKVQSSGMDLSRNIVPLPIREPSQTLFSLLGLLMDVLRELSSVTEVMSGEQPKANMPAASIDMLIEQGKKLFNSVYKRHYRSLTDEMNALFDMNFLYQDPVQYAELLDLQEVPKEQLMELIQADFSREGLDLQPTANAEFSSKIQRRNEAQALYQVKDDPTTNGSLIMKMYIESIIDDKEIVAAVVPEQPNMTPEQAMQQTQQQMQE